LIKEINYRVKGTEKFWNRPKGADPQKVDQAFFAVHLTKEALSAANFGTVLGVVAPEACSEAVHEVVAN
ncbi:MAG: hypothetical protein WCJ35_28715, partial [Planctomycetota bacterium]